MHIIHVQLFCNEEMVAKTFVILSLKCSQELILKTIQQTAILNRIEMKIKAIIMKPIW